MSAWRTSTRSGGGDCVQAAPAPRGVKVRDSKAPAHVLALTGRQWAGLINAIKEGQ